MLLFCMLLDYLIIFKLKLFLKPHFLVAEDGLESLPGLGVGY